MRTSLVDKIGAFTTVPNTVIRLWPIIGIDAVCLFLYLRYRTNNESETAFPSYNTISNDTLLSRKRIAGAIRELESIGLVDRKKRYGQSTIYTLKFPDPTLTT